MKNIRICVVFGDSLLTEGIERMLIHEEGLEVTGVEAREENLPARLQGLHPDIILVDQSDSLAISILQSHQIYSQEPEAKLIIVDLNSNRISVHHKEETIVTGKDRLIDALRRFGSSSY